MTVGYNGQTSAPAPINVVGTQFGLFTANAQGNGPAVAQVFSGSAAPVFMGLTTPAHPGETIVIVGTGLGGITGPDNAGPGAILVGSNVIVTIGGIVATTNYAGRSPQFPGEDQINFVVPANVPTGCYVPASVTASGQVSQGHCVVDCTGRTLSARATIGTVRGRFGYARQRRNSQYRGLSSAACLCCTIRPFGRGSRRAFR